MFSVNLDDFDFDSSISRFHAAASSIEAGLDRVASDFEPEEFEQFWNGSLVSLLSREGGEALAVDRAEACMLNDIAAQIAVVGAARAAARLCPDQFTDENMEETARAMKDAANDAVGYKRGVSVDVSPLINCCDVEVDVSGSTASVTVYSQNDVRSLSILAVDDVYDAHFAAVNAIAAIREVEEAAEGLRAARKKAAKLVARLGTDPCIDRTLEDLERIA